MEDRTDIIDDQKTARGWLASDGADSSAAEARFGTWVRMSYDRRKIEIGLGLEYAEFFRAVMVRAARAFTASCPIHADFRLDPFVARVAAAEDLALTILMIRGVPRAWEIFRERHEAFLRAAFAAGGRPGVEINALVEEVIHELQGKSGPGPDSPIARYGGTAPMKAWLFVFIRRTFGGGVGNVLTKTSAFSILDATDDSSVGGTNDDAIADDLLRAADDSLRELDEDERRALAVRAGGMRVPATDAELPATGAEAQHALVARIFRHVTTRIAGMRGWMQFEADRLLVERARRRTYEHMRGIHED